MEWQDISTAPKDGMSILAWHDFHKCPVAIRWVAEGIWTQCNGKMHWIEKTGTTGWPEEAFSHWMPLPPAPEAPDAP